MAAWRYPNILLIFPWHPKTLKNNAFLQREARGRSPPKPLPPEAREINSLVLASTIEHYVDASCIQTQKARAISSRKSASPETSNIHIFCWPAISKVKPKIWIHNHNKCNLEVLDKKCCTKSRQSKRVLILRTIHPSGTWSGNVFVDVFDGLPDACMSCGAVAASYTRSLLCA